MREPAIKEGYAYAVYPVRWQPYHHTHVKRTGKKGRWQRLNEWGGWDNCEAPEVIIPNNQVAEISAYIQDTLLDPEKRDITNG